MKYRVIKSINGWYTPQVFVADSWHLICSVSYGNAEHAIQCIEEFSKMPEKQLGMFVPEKIIYEMENLEEIDLNYGGNT